LFKNTAAVAIWGNSKWKQKPRDEQAEADGTDECERVSKLFGIPIDDLLKNLLKPRIKVKLKFAIERKSLS
jgi:myosin heavy chain 6/7